MTLFWLNDQYGFGGIREYMNISKLIKNGWLMNIQFNVLITQIFVDSIKMLIVPVKYNYSCIKDNYRLFIIIY